MFSTKFKTCLILDSLENAQLVFLTIRALKNAETVPFFFEWRIVRLRLIEILMKLYFFNRDELAMDIT
jgi:hypothetical protein